MVKDTPPAEMLVMLRQTLNFDSWISEDDIQNPDDSIMANLAELQIAAAKYKTIADFIEYVDTFREVRRSDKNGVGLMTMHKAKGLEFPVVFCIGFVDGTLPNACGDLEEERRIAFVGISRAMKLLYCSYTTIHNGKAVRVSPFLNELLGAKKH